MDDGSGMWPWLCVQVTLSDGGLPVLSSRTRLVVSVTDVNDVRPRFLDLQYRVRVPRVPAAADLLRLGVYRVVAADDDLGPNADLEYSIAGVESRDHEQEQQQHPFSIDSHTGMIFAQRQLDVGGHYDLQVTLMMATCCPATRVVNLSLPY